MNFLDLAAILDALRTATGSFTRIEKELDRVEPEISELSELSLCTSCHCPTLFRGLLSGVAAAPSCHHRIPRLYVGVAD